MSRLLDALVVVAAAALVALTGVVLGNLPPIAAMRQDHALVGMVADELAWSAMLVVAALAAVVGDVLWRRWSTVIAALHVAVGVVGWSVDARPLALERTVHVRLAAAAALVATLAIATPWRGWSRAGRRSLAGVVVLAAVLLAGAWLVADVVRWWIGDGGSAVRLALRATATLAAAAIGTWLSRRGTADRGRRARRHGAS